MSMKYITDIKMFLVIMEQDRGEYFKLPHIKCSRTQEITSRYGRENIKVIARVISNTIGSSRES